MARPKNELIDSRTKRKPSLKTGSSTTGTYLESHFKSAIESIDKIARNVREEELIMQSENDWKFVAMVIDRCFLWIFVLVCIVGTTTLFVQPLGKINNEWAWLVNWKNQSTYSCTKLYHEKLNLIIIMAVVNTNLQTTGNIAFI